jgi:hypothetical protein
MTVARQGKYVYCPRNSTGIPQYITRGFRISQNDEDLQALRDRMNASPVKIAAEPEPQDFFASFKNYFSRLPNE